MSNTFKPMIAAIYHENAAGQEVETIVKTTMKDLAAYDIHAHKNHWPQAQAAPFVWTSFIAWSALRRASDAPPEISGLSYDDFMDRITTIAPVEDEAGEVEGESLQLYPREATPEP